MSLFGDARLPALFGHYAVPPKAARPAPRPVLGPEPLDILEALARQTGAATLRVVARAAAVAEMRAKAHLGDLASEGLVRRTEGSGHKAAAYELTDAGRARAGRRA